MAAGSVFEGSESQMRSGWWKFRWLAAVMLLVVVGWQLAGLAIAASYLYRDHHDLQPLELPQERGLACHEVVIRVGNGSEAGEQGAGGQGQDGEADLQLAGWLLPADPTLPQYQQGATIIMLHGFSSSRAKVWEDPADNNYRGSMFDQGAESLVKGGFHLLLIDFRNHGDSGDRGTVTLGLREQEDVLAALDFLDRGEFPAGIQIDRQRIGVRAESMGGAAAIFAAANEPSRRISGMWIDSTFARADQVVGDFLGHAGVPAVFMPPVKYWLETLAGIRLDQVRPVDALTQVACPVMLVHSEGDTMVPVEHWHQLVRAAGDLPHVETWLLQRWQHNRLWQEPEYHARQLEFFQRVLAGVDNVDKD